MSSIFLNYDLRGLCLLHNFHLVLNFRSHLCGDGVHLTEGGTELFAGHIVIVLNDFI